MIRLLCCLVTLACCIPAASADDKHPSIDLATFTCGDFIRNLEGGREQDMQTLVIWLDGYLSGIAGNTELSWHELKQYRHDLATYCRKNTSTSMQEAARKAGM
jgi:acid stress chaperone HdeB